jgi:hypothetical protein
MVVEIRPEMEDLHSQNWEILGDLIQKNVGKTMSFLPPMTGNGKHSTYKNADDWWMVHMALF